MAPDTLTREIFLERMLNSPHGGRTVYHVGSLMLDRKKAWNFLQVHDVAGAAMVCAEKGYCRLVQRRVGQGSFEYVAIRQRPTRPIVWSGCYDPTRKDYTRPNPQNNGNPYGRKGRTPEPSVVARKMEGQPPIANHDCGAAILDPASV